LIQAERETQESGSYINFNQLLHTSIQCQEPIASDSPGEKKCVNN